MRVCLITSLPLPPEEGIGHHVWNLAQQLTQRGHQVDVVTRGTLAPLSSECKQGITIWRPRFAPIYPVHIHTHGFFVNRLLHALAGRFDIINAHTPLPPAIYPDIPLVTTVHSPMKSDTAATHGMNVRSMALRMHTPVFQQIENTLFRRSSRITAVAQWVAYALEAYGVQPNEVLITGNGVERSFLEKRHEGEAVGTVLYVGRLELGKGLLELVAAAATLRRRCPDLDLRFILVGKGPLLPTLRNAIDQAGLADRFELKGHIGVEDRHELVQLYQKATLFVLPSHHEGMPTVLLEAMAVGLPVISTAVGGALEVIEDGVNGILVPPRQPDRLANAMFEVLGNASLRRTLGQNAKDTVEQRFSWRAICDQYLACYEQVVQA